MPCRSHARIAVKYRPPPPPPTTGRAASASGAVAVVLFRATVPLRAAAAVSNCSLLLSRLARLVRPRATARFASTAVCVFVGVPDALGRPGGAGRRRWFRGARRLERVAGDRTRDELGGEERHDAPHREAAVLELLVLRVERRLDVEGVEDEAGRACATNGAPATPPPRTRRRPRASEPRGRRERHETNDETETNEAQEFGVGR